MNKRRTARTIKQIRSNISNLQYIDNELFSKEELDKLEEIRKFFVDMTVKLRELKN